MDPIENISKRAETRNTAENIRSSIQSIKEDGVHIAEAMIEQGQDKYNQGPL